MTQLPRAPQWAAWGQEPFERARDAGIPVLLVIGAPWSRGAVEMHETTFRDDDVLELIERRFVPILVSADDRPDVADRYGLGGWPTTAFLTPDGRLLGGQTFTAPAEMVALLGRVADAFANRRDELMAPAPTRGDGTSVRATMVRAEGVDATIESWLSAHLLDAYDPDHGGFGRSSKRIQEAPLLVTLGPRRGRSSPPMPQTAREEDLRSVAAHTLARAGASQLCDEEDGGLFRYAVRRDWTEPSREKLLTVNAAGLRVFLEGWRALDDEAHRERALWLIRYVQHTLFDAEAERFLASQTPDDGASERPPVDRACFTAASADMARSLMRAADVLGDPSLLSCAVSVLDGTVAAAYRQGEGILRRVGGERSVRGLLVDHVSVSEALVDAYEATARDVYRDLAHELMLYAVRLLWNDNRGGFVDRVVNDDDVGLLRYTLTPFTLNCRAAGVLARLGRATDQPDLTTRAQAVLAAQTPTAKGRSIDAASYVLALREL